MKKSSILLAAIMLLVFLIPFSVMAEEMAIRPVEDVLAEIRQEQGAATNEQIDVTKVSSEKLEELGDSVMEELIGNHAMHERMDARLGGEGSEALADYHRTLATKYLTGAPLGMMGGMWRGPRTGIDGRAGNYMMGNGWMGIGWIVAILVGLFVLAAIGLIIFLIARIGHGSMRSGVNHNGGQSEISTNALNVLAERYARGEIDDDEYARKKAELRK